MNAANGKARKYVRRMLRTRRRLSETDVREALRTQLRHQYEAGASVRELAKAHKLAFGTVRTLLLEAGVTLRSRGGPNHVRQSPGPEEDNG
jgi:hypothetical protein